MKTVITTLALLTLFSCQKKAPYVKQSIQVNVIVDITDSHQVLPDANSIINLFGLSDDIDREVWFRLMKTTDKVLNPVVRVHLLDGRTTDKENTREVPMHRHKIVRAFYQEIRNIIERFNHERALDTPLKHTECFSMIACQLRDMKKNICTKNILLIYSDLQENSKLFSCYSPKGKALLENNPEEVIKIFESFGILPNDLSGIEVVCIYNPKTREDDIRYRRMAAIYQHLLVSRGAKLTVQANN